MNSNNSDPDNFAKLPNQPRVQQKDGSYIHNSMVPRISSDVQYFIYCTVSTKFVAHSRSIESLISHLYLTFVTFPAVLEPNFIRNGINCHSTPAQPSRALDLQEEVGMFSKRGNIMPSKSDKRFQYEV